jgi:Colicin M
MKAKLNRKEVVRRLTALGVQPANQQYVLRKLGLEVAGYDDGGSVMDPSTANDAPDPPRPGDLYPAQKQISGSDNAEWSLPGDIYPPGMPETSESYSERLEHIPGYFWHYLTDSHEHPREIPISDIDTSTLKIARFHQIKQVLDAGVPGTYPVIATQSLQTDFPESKYLGHLNHHLFGQLTIDNSGRYSFRGTLTAGPDYYNMNPSPARTQEAEAETTFGRTTGRIFGDTPFHVHVKGSKSLSETGKLPLPLLTRKATI